VIQCNCPRRQNRGAKISLVLINEKMMENSNVLEGSTARAIANLTRGKNRIQIILSKKSIQGSGLKSLWLTLDRGYVSLVGDLRLLVVKGTPTKLRCQLRHGSAEDSVLCP
jgi:hypothetical protein